MAIQPNFGIDLSSRQSIVSIMSLSGFHFVNVEQGLDSLFHAVLEHLEQLDDDGVPILLFFASQCNL